MGINVFSQIYFVIISYLLTISRVVIVSWVLISCSSKPFDQYVDHFYGYKGSSDQKEFKYILSVGKDGDDISPTDARALLTAHEEKRPKDKRGTNRKAGPDDFMPFSFRMEEEAFKRLDKRLLDNNYCDNGVVYLKREYTWLKYTIRGQCKP